MHRSMVMETGLLAQRESVNKMLVVLLNRQCLCPLHVGKQTRMNAGSAFSNQNLNRGVVFVKDKLSFQIVLFSFFRFLRKKKGADRKCGSTSKTLHVYGRATCVYFDNVGVFVLERDMKRG